LIKKKKQKKGNKTLHSKTVISSHFCFIAEDIYVCMCFVVMGYGMHMYIHVWQKLYYLLILHMFILSVTLMVLIGNHFSRHYDHMNMIFS
jgi:hypothetical protein